MPTENGLRPLDFHVNLASTLEAQEPGLWRWFASDDYGKKYAENVKLELLRATYRLPREAHERLYALAAEVAQALGVTVPLTLYQSQGSGTLNAGLVFAATEAHVVLQGPVVETLNEAEVRALFGHELAHHKLWTEAQGRFHTADVLIEHIVRQPGCAPSHQQSALRYRRWTELYADRGSLLACGELNAAISCLVKMSTGLRTVDPNAYLAQANEALTATDESSRGLTHPEEFIRAWGLSDWHAGGDGRRLALLVQGPMELETLDLVQQVSLTDATRKLIAVVLAPQFMRTDATLTHARRFFPDVTFDGPQPSLEGLESLPRGGASLAEYYAYVLLDLALADAELEDRGLAHAAQVARRLGLHEVLPRLARKELRLSAASWADIERQSAELQAEVAS